MKNIARIKDNIIINVNPKGCHQNIENQIQDIKNKETLTQKPLRVLVIGGSSGYGLSTRIVLNEKTNANIINVSFEREPKGKREGSPGYYQNQAMLKKYPHTIDLMGDAFSHEMKQEVIKALNGEKLDLIVYSLASGIRIDPDSQEKYVSALRPIGKGYTGINVDIAKETLKEETLDAATKEEITQTIKVMGGEDYLLWIQTLKDADALNENVKVVTYTYHGPELTHDIYKNGTIGLAKRDLETKNEAIKLLLKDLNGKAYVSASKAVITKASIFIPTMALYASALFKVMKEKNVHESIVEHKYRLFKDYIFNDDFNEAHIPLDQYEMDADVQKETTALLNQITQDNFKDLIDFENFKKEFVALNGF